MVESAAERLSLGVIFVDALMRLRLKDNSRAELTTAGCCFCLTNCVSEIAMSILGRHFQIDQDKV